MAETRSFHMGFTPHPYDFTEAAFAKTYELINANGDIIGHHLDEGVPWEASLSGAQYPVNVIQDLHRRKTGTPEGQTVFLSVTPLAISRVGLADTWGRDSHMPNSASFAGRGLNDPKVIKAFIKYSLRMIEYFQPKYFAYAIEISDLADKPVQRAQFLDLARETYRAVKAKHPELKVFPTFALGNGDYFKRGLGSFMQELAPYMDLIAVSTYPYVWDGVGGDAAALPQDWFGKIAEAVPGKGFAVAETGFLAGSYKNLRHLVWIPAKPKDQRRYVSRLLREAQERNAEFVIWYVPVDYDLLWQKMKAQGMSKWFAQWMRTGLWNANLKGRPALDVWQDWLSRPRVR